MAVDEAARHRLHTKLECVRGSDEAADLMAYLPPVGWADVARKSDLDRLATKEDLHEIRAEMERLGRRLVMWVASMVVAVAGLAFAAGRFV